MTKVDNDGNDDADADADAELSFVTVSHQARQSLWWVVCARYGRTDGRTERMDAMPVDVRVFMKETQETGSEPRHSRTQTPSVKRVDVFLDVINPSDISHFRSRCSRRTDRPTNQPTNQRR